MPPVSCRPSQAARQCPCLPGIFAYALYSSLNLSPSVFLDLFFVILVRTVTAIAVEGVDRHARLGGSGLHRSLTDQNAVILDNDLRWCQGRSTLSRLCPFGRDEIADASLELIGYSRIAFGLPHRRHDLLARCRGPVQACGQLRRPAIVLIEALAHPGRIGSAVQHLIAAADRLEGPGRRFGDDRCRLGRGVHDRKKFRRGGHGKHPNGEAYLDPHPVGRSPFDPSKSQAPGLANCVAPASQKQFSGRVRQLPLCKLRYFSEATVLLPSALTSSPCLCSASHRRFVMHTLGPSRRLSVCAWGG